MGEADDSESDGPCNLLSDKYKADRVPGLTNGDNTVTEACPSLERDCIEPTLQ